MDDFFYFYFMHSERGKTKKKKREKEEGISKTTDFKKRKTKFISVSK